MTVCSGTLEHVELALLEGSELSSAAQAHLSTCSACSAEATALRAIVSLLNASPAPEAPAGLTARLVPLVLVEAQKSRRQGVFARVMRPVAAFATAFGAMVTLVVTVGTAFVVAAAITGGSRLPTPATQTPTSQPATAAPATEAPATLTPATPAPATEAPAETSTPEATPTPEPTDVPRRTPEPVSPDPSEGEPTAPTEGTSP
jgi:anti-sigma factor RsiW